MKIGTRGSKLALWQAHTVARLIKETGGPDCEIIVIRTSGDETTGPPDPPVTTLGTIGTLGTLGTIGTLNVKHLFVKEIEEALVDGRIDVAVHSSKDLSAELPGDLYIAAALEREDPRDAIVLPGVSAPKEFHAVARLIGHSPRIGTSSVRRVAQLRGIMADATFSAIRGNVDTRLRKLDSGECDAIVLAVAGLKRLGFEHRLTAPIPVDVCVPAPGQGIVAVEMSPHAATELRDAVRRISDADAETALLAERAVVRALGGGCQMPLGALARVDGQELAIQGVVASMDGRTFVRGVVHGHRGGAAAAGDKLAAQLLSKGAGDLLK
jgi:hydroxymethylbilane synthase